MRTGKSMWLAGMLAGLLSGVAPVLAGEQPLPSLEREMVRQAPGVLRHFKARGCQNVGVLKFLVNKDGERFSDNVGTLNLLLARQLEIALILANDPRAPIGVIHNASAVAARTSGASHLSAPGRDKLFSVRYPLAWGNKEVQADGFISGVVQVSKDLQTLTISLLVWDRKDRTLRNLGEEFRTANSAGNLTAMGESFSLRGLFNAGTTEVAGEERKAVEAAVKVKEQKQVNPLTVRREEQPVTLTVLYDGKPVSIEYRGGQAFLPEPAEGQKVSFQLGRDGSKERYGVVLKVNGENTIARQTLPDVRCRLWVLGPEQRPFTLRGYQMDEKSAQEFVVLSRGESKAREVNYGADVGTITMTVFGERRGAGPAPAEGREERYSEVVAGARAPGKPAPTFGALKHLLLEDANQTRGLIGEGAVIGSRVNTTTFTPHPVPLMSVTITYYKP